MGKLLYMGINGSILIAAITCFRHFFFHQIPKRFLVFLWICAITRLLLPIAIPVRLTTGNYKNMEAVSGSQQINASTANGTSDAGLLVYISSASAAKSLKTEKPAIWLKDCIFAIWLTVAALLAIRISIKHLHSRRLYNMSLPICEERSTAWLQAHHSIRKVTLRKSEFVSSPLTYGIIHPVILLPSGLHLEDKEFLCVMEHEWIHIRWWDVFVKYLLYLAVCIYWFHPLVWMMAGLLSRDMELACDEEVVKTFPDSRRQTYALTLIRLAECPKDSIWPVHAGFARHTEIEERISFIMKTKKYSWKAAVLAMGMVCCTITTFTAFAQEASEEMPMQTPMENNTQLDKHAIDGQASDTNAPEVPETIMKNDESTAADRDAAKKQLYADEDLSAAKAASEETRLSTQEQVVELAEKYLGAPYKFGGTDLSDGVDSPGFVKAIYAQVGINLPADLHELAAGRTDIPMSELSAGDIIIYSAADGGDKLFHAAIYDGNGKVIHASNMRDGVKISDLNYRETSMAIRVLE